MEARFRIRTREGEELRPRTTEIFAEFIRSGVVRPEDLVHDALTGEWVPAAMHPMVRLMRDPLANGVEPLEGAPLPPVQAWSPPEDAEDGAPGADVVEARQASDAEEPGDDLMDALRLVELPTVSPEEEARAFIARMEDERSLGPDESALSREMSLTPATPGAPVAPVVPEAQPASVSPVAPMAPVAVGAPEVVEDWRGPVSQRATKTLRRPSGVEAAFTLPGHVRHSWARLGALGLAVAASLAFLAVFATVAKPSYRVGDRMPEMAGPEAVPARPPHRIAATESAVRDAAFAGFATSVDRMRGGLGVGPVPSDWLSGKYLSDARAYPQIRGYWQRYLGYVEQAQADEVNLYRAAYLQALDDAGVVGPVRSLRLATALEDFAAGRDARALSYSHVWELAAAALALHDTLVELEGRISYEPAVGSRVSADPVIEAAGTDEEAQARFDAALDRVLEALHADGRTMDVASVPGWLERSLREGVAGRIQGP